MTIERKVAIVTGANTGVGYAIVERLMDESPDPLTIILACRNKNRAEEALHSLQDLLSQKQRQAQKQDQCGEDENHEGNDKHRRHHYYHRDTQLRIELVDVGSAASVLAFNQRILDQYPRINYLFCNAGILPSIRLNWAKLVVDMFTAPMDLLTRSDVLVQPKQHLTEDGVGNVLACNVFGHYIMIKSLESVLDGTEEDPGRVIWTSSITAEKNSFVREDWQGLESEQPYESSKWVTDLLAIRLNQIWANGHTNEGSKESDGAFSTGSASSSGSESYSSALPERRVTRSASKVALAETKTTTSPSNKNNTKRHIVSLTTHPGVVASGIGGLATWIVMLRIMVHYVARFFGERNQTISGRHGALANVHVALKKPVLKLDYQYKYGSCVGRVGKEFIHLEKMVEYDESQAKIVVDELEKLREQSVIAASTRK
ncbi:hypothetical protein BG011_003829 [Mortierella polycephala]|uniref:3-keto-steroid reductase n=1 Tax=Mortierella polycephala TaxID=41804 RepID=A0A9P6QG83_9FUNG|nr:hypothetical protein BG011_003829 [Mortierella polycephala]